MSVGALVNLFMGLYDRGLLGGSPKRLRNMAEEISQLQLSEEKQKQQWLNQPAYGPQYAPGEEPGVNVVPYLEDVPTRRDALGQAGLLNAQNLLQILQANPADPIKSEITKRFMGLGMSPEQVNKLFGDLPSGIAYPSQPMRKTEEITKAKEAGRPGFKGLAQDYGAILQGVAPAPQQPAWQTFAGGQGVMQTQGPGAGPGTIQATGYTGTQTPASLQEFELWKSNPPADIKERAAQEGREISYGDYQIWKWEQRSKAQIEAIAGKDPEKQLALQMAKADAAQRLDPLRGGSIDMPPEEITRTIMDLWEQYYVFLKSGGTQRPEGQTENPLGLPSPKK